MDVDTIITSSNGILNVRFKIYLPHFVWCRVYLLKVLIAWSMLLNQINI